MYIDIVTIACVME